MGPFKAPPVGAHGAGKGPFFMAKEFGLQEFFACTRLARDQHRCIGWPINLNFTQHADKSRCMSQEPVEALRRPDLVCSTGLPWQFLQTHPHQSVLLTRAARTETG